MYLHILNQSCCIKRIDPMVNSPPTLSAMTLISQPVFLGAPRSEKKEFSIKTNIDFNYPTLFFTFYILSRDA